MERRTRRTGRREAAAAAAAPLRLHHKRRPRFLLVMVLVVLLSALAKAAVQGQGAGSGTVLIAQDPVFVQQESGGPSTSLVDAASEAERARDNIDMVWKQHGHVGGADMHRRPELTKEQLNILKERDDYLKEHEGHEDMHIEIFFVLVGVLTVTQIGMLVWRKHSPKSFQKVTLVGLVLIPPVISYRLSYWRFLYIWGIFTLLNTPIVKSAFKQPLTSHIPRKVYRWFFVVFVLCLHVGIISIVMFVIELAGLRQCAGGSPDSSFFETAFVLAFYALYFGVLGRDFADLCSERMATSLGFINQDGMPARTIGPHMCGVCSNDFCAFEMQPVHLATVEDGCCDVETGEEGEAGTDFCKDACKGSFNFKEVKDTLKKKITAKLSSLDKFKQFVLKTRHIEQNFKLDCGHSFHEWCIRGWILLGKKDLCPVCKEKVDLKVLHVTPWDAFNFMHATLLDRLRYLIVWYPFMILAFKLSVHVLGLK